MPRVIAGSARGIELRQPPGRGTRPTSGRLREALFSMLEAAGADFTEVLDLYAGTGALGIEALSRGARYCLLVEDDAQARALIRRNVESFGLTGVTRIWRRDATDLGPAGNMQPFDVAFLDPPYGRGLGEKALAALTEGNWLAPGALAVLEERAGVPVSPPPAFTELDRRTWGDTEVYFFRFS